MYLLTKCLYYFTSKERLIKANLPECIAFNFSQCHHFKKSEAVITVITYIFKSIHSDVSLYYNLFSEYMYFSPNMTATRQ
jgi:hypothetical protein